MLLCFKTKLEFKKAPSTSHSAAHPGLWHEASGYSVQKGSVSKSSIFRIQQAALISTNRSLATKPSDLLKDISSVFNSHFLRIYSGAETKQAEVLAGEKVVLAIRKLALFQNTEHLATSCV